jgi:hypothetical protein
MSRINDGRMAKKKCEHGDRNEDEKMPHGIRLIPYTHFKGCFVSVKAHAPIYYKRSCWKFVSRAFLFSERHNLTFFWFSQGTHTPENC